jgi:ATP-binding cassette subfamily B protein
LVLLFPLILIILIVNWMKKRIECLFAEQQKAADGVNNALADLFSYAFTIKNNHAEEYFLQRFQRCNDERMKKVMQNDIFDTCLHSIYGNIINIGTGFILLLISRKIYNGSFTIGQFSLFVYFLNYVSNVTRLLGKTIAGLKRVAVSYERLKKVIPENTFHIVTDQRSSLQKKVEMVESTETVEQLERLDVKDLSYTYPNSTKGIRDITFSLERGSFTVISGKVGSGKSTLLKVLLGLLPADQGEIVWNEQHVRERNQFFVPPRAAYVPQEPHLFSETLHENIRLGSRVSAERVAEAIRLAVLEEDVEGLVHRLDTAIGTGGVNLSGGQRQRTAAARMFVRDAELWVLDDISSALDVQTEKELWRRVKEYVMEEQITCLVVTNKQYAMQYADQVICLDEVK